jgi:release factor glutamine methyltransferase
MDNVLDLVSRIMQRLKKLHDDPVACQQDAWWIVQALTKKSEAELIAHKEIHLSEKQNIQLEQWLIDHIDHHKPLQYILGTVPFGDLTIVVEPPILIPRPETEEWCLNLGEDLKKVKHTKLSVLDIGCGTGCIALSLAHISPLWIVQGVDISEHAIALSTANALKNKITNTSFTHADAFTNLPEQKYDLIVSNPPYIPEDAWKTLNPSVAQWEDKRALTSGNDGLDAIRAIVNYARMHLKENSDMKTNNLPQLVLEIDETQGKQLTDILKKSGFSTSRVIKDLEGKDRVVYARL